MNMLMAMTDEDLQIHVSPQSIVRSGSHAESFHATMKKDWTLND